MSLSHKIESLSSNITPARFEKMKRAAEFRTYRITVVLEDIFQPHNAAAVLRNCDAFGVQTAHFIENKYLSRISADVDMGSSKWMDVFRYQSSVAQKPKAGIPKRDGIARAEIENTERVLKRLKSAGYVLAASTLRPCSSTVEDVPVDAPVALMLGTELTGLTDMAHDMADVMFSMPMYGFAQSFNLSVFSALALSRISERMRALGDDWRLSETEREELLLRWLET